MNSQMKFSWRSLCVQVLALALAACAGDSNDDDPAPTPIALSPSPSYSVGGSVTGLGAGQSVVVRNGAESVTVSSNAAFTFPTKLASGATYAVSVVAPQPAGKTCTVTGGTSGAIGNANVTNVVVTCVAGVSSTFSVGGSVTGLGAGQSVVVRNGAESVTVSSNAAFTFPTKLASGATYAVSVVAPQPAGKTCTVTGGASGAIGNANVTNVVVTCVAGISSTFSVGGSVTGLGTGQSVILRNGAENVTVSSNTTFTFPTKLATGAAYAVTVVAPQPAGKTCAVTSGGSGNIGNANVTNVTVNCATTVVSTFSVGGSVSGLGTGQAVVLRNGSENLTVSSNAAFTFATKLASGAAYAVTVVAPQPTGKTCSVASGGSGTIGNANVTNVVVACVGASGSLDTSFGTRGFALHNNAAGGSGNDVGQAVTIDASGRIVVAGHSKNPSGSLSMAVWRYNANGSLDTTFNGKGFATNSGSGESAGTEAVATAVKIDSAGRIVAAGYNIGADGLWGVAVWRFLANGTLDTSFSGSGMARRTAPRQQGGVGMAIDSSGRIVVSGFSYDPNNGFNIDMAVWRFNADGTPDTTFAGVGYVYHPSAAGGSGEDLAVGMKLDSSGRIVVTGYSTNAAGDHDMALWRLNTDGSFDTSFNGKGFATFNNPNGGGTKDDVGRAIAFDSTGKIVVTGWSPGAASGDDLAVWRVNSNGTLDTSFNATGWAIHNGAAGGNGVEEGRDIAIDSAGRIYAVGKSLNAAGNGNMVVWRYNTNGTLDASFNGKGFVVYAASAGGTGSDQARGIVIDASGRLVVIGSSINAATDADMLIWRINP